jgi:hypothetical protein
MFNPGDHLMNIGTANKPRMYLEVKYRLVWFREQCPEGTIETEVVHLDLDREVSAEVFEWDESRGKSIKVTKHGKGLAIFRATVKDGKGGIATGTKSENNAAFRDFIEKSETGSIGRALAALGYGTQFTDDEDEGERIVDALVERKPQPASHQPAKQTTPQQESKLLPGQFNALKSLYVRLNETIPADLDQWSFAQASATIQGLQSKLKQAS